MQAFQLVAPQQPPELREVPVPEPGPGQVLVKVGVAGAGSPDFHQHLSGPGLGHRHLAQLRWLLRRDELECSHC